MRRRSMTSDGLERHGRGARAGENDAADAVERARGLGHLLASGAGGPDAAAEFRRAAARAALSGRAEPGIGAAWPHAEHGVVAQLLAARREEPAPQAYAAAGHHAARGVRDRRDPRDERDAGDGDGLEHGGLEARLERAVAALSSLVAEIGRQGGHGSMRRPHRDAAGLPPGGGFRRGGSEAPFN